MTAMLQGGFDNPQFQSAVAFRAIMRAMAQPGTIETIEAVDAPAPLSVAAGVAILTLCDAETPLYLAPSHDCAPVRDWITFHTNAPLVAASEAMFALGVWADLQATEFPVGTSEYPDRSTTVIVDGHDLGAGGNTLSGPGIKDSVSLALPDGFAARNSGVPFPLGLDFLITHGDRLAAIPRTTRVA